MNQIVRISALLWMLMAAFPCHADLIPMDSSYGTNTIIRDTITNLDWLKLTVTQNRSITDISSKFGAGQEFAGFRYARIIEVGQLFLDAGLPVVPSDTSPYGNLDFSQNASDLLVVSNLINLFGQTEVTADGFGSAGLLANHGFVGPDDAEIAVLFIQTDLACAAVHCASARPLSAGQGAALDTAFPDAGSFLVRRVSAAVPEPGSWSLVAAALGIVAWRNRRSRAE